MTDPVIIQAEKLETQLVDVVAFLRTKGEYLEHDIKYCTDSAETLSKLRAEVVHLRTEISNFYFHTPSLNDEKRVLRELWQGATDSFQMRSHIRNRNNLGSTQKELKHLKETTHAKTCEDVINMMAKLGTEVARLREGLGHRYYSQHTGMYTHQLYAMTKNWNDDPSDFSIIDY